MTTQQKLNAFNLASKNYEAALEDYRSTVLLADEGKVFEQTLDEVKEEVVAAQVRYEAAERALNG